MKNIIAVFIDEVAPKNKLQVQVINNLKLSAVFFVTKYNKESVEFLGYNNEQNLVSANFFKRLINVSSYFWKNRRSMHHIEVYPAGAFSFIYILLARLFSIKTICVERGDILYFNSKKYSFLARFSMFITYKFSELVWYREPYMKDRLQKIGIKKLFFLHNAINSDFSANSTIVKKDIDFLWLNRVITERKSEWFIEILKKPEFSKTRNCLVGLNGHKIFKAEHEYLINNKPENLEVHSYNRNVRKYYERAKFFVLPADVVFANNSLLEAMSYGVVPIVSKQQGSELIVENRVNGFMSDHSKEHFEKVMSEAMNLNESDYNHYSIAAKQKINQDFSEQKYSDGLAELYKLCEE